MRLSCPPTDPTPIFELFRGNFATELLTVAAVDFQLFERLARGPRSREELRHELGLAERPAVVLLSALQAMGLLAAEPDGRLGPTAQASNHLLASSPFFMGGYIGLMADSPGVRNLAERLRTNVSAARESDDLPTEWIYRPSEQSAMDEADSARRLTLALAGRAANVAPVLAERYPLADARLLLDVGGGSGIYSIAWLQRHPQLRAIVWDRPAVLAVAQEMADRYGVAERLECRPGDMFGDPVPAADAILLSNILHDWDVRDARRLVSRCAAALPPGGRLLIHDVFLADGLDGPLPVALYSAALFCVTEGRAYSELEYRSWLTASGLCPQPIVPTLVHCGVLPATRPAPDR